MYRAIILILGLLAMVAPASAQVKLKGEGATFPKPLYDVWISRFHDANSGIEIDYQGTASGAGIKAITNRTVDFAGSDVKLSKSESAAAGDVIYFPTCAGAVAAGYNLPGFGDGLRLSGPVLADIFQGKIARWNDRQIAALNPGAKLPDLAITPVYRSDGSGTNAVFSKYLSLQSDEFAQKVGAGKSVQWPVGQGALANAGVTKVVNDVPGALGYVELNYALANHVAMAALKNKVGKFVKPTLETVSAAAGGATAIPADVLDQPGDNAYPITSFTYILVHKDLGQLGDRDRAAGLVRFLTWALGDGQKLAAEQSYVPLPPSIAALATKEISELSFHGEPMKP